jgi:DNA-binding CsgD family transcriptional regulator
MAPNGAGALDSLTPRQREILSLVADGASDKQIAARLGISYRTVRTHLERLSARYGTHGRTALAILAIASFAEAGGAYVGQADFWCGLIFACR